jgi:hypothetical protein
MESEYPVKIGPVTLVCVEEPIPPDELERRSVRALVRPYVPDVPGAEPVYRQAARDPGNGHSPASKISRANAAGRSYWDNI